MREQLQEILSTVSRNKLRTFLTGFSVAWGIFMLIILLGSGNGLKHATDESFSDMTVNSMQLGGGWTSMPYKGFQSGRRVLLSEDDMQVLKAAFPKTIDKITASVYHSGATISKGKESSSTTVCGVNPEFEKIEAIDIVEGRFINETDIRERRKVVVIGDMTIQTLFKGANPVGQSVIIDKSGYTVIGTYKTPRGSYGSTIYAPISTVFLTYMGDKRDVGSISFTVNGITTDKEGYEFKKQVSAQLGAIHKFSPDDQNAVWIQDRLSWYRNGQMMANGIMLFIWIIGIGTLIAGVVGVSNIMLVTVRERTFEFGVRKAMGAKPASLVKLILLESILIMASFGYMGMICGVGIMEIVNLFMERAATAAPDQDITLFKNPTLDLSVTFSATLVLVIAGIIAGYVPARRAARIKTIDAMRHNK